MTFFTETSAFVTCVLSSIHYRVEHVLIFGHILMTQYVLVSGEATHINLLIFGLTKPGILLTRKWR